VEGPAGALAVDDGGRDGVAVLCVHSLAGNASQWSPQLEHLRTARRAAALELRGHGGSEPPRDGDYSVEQMAGDVAAVAGALRLERFVLAGHSMGGAVALACAGASPARVAGLFLVDPNGDAREGAAGLRGFLERLESSQYQETIREYWSRMAGPDPAVRQRVLRDLEATPRTTVVECFKATLRYDPRVALARYRGPALSIVTPYNDQPFSLHRLGEGLPHEVVMGTGHWLQLDRPERINRRLDRFLDQVEAAGPRAAGASGASASNEPPEER
jgi:pimeloyl-ACP methyl ester carboxylesterase